MVTETPSAVNEPPPSDMIRRDAQIEARLMSTDALLVWRELLELDLASPDPDYPGEIGRYLASERLVVVDTELGLREHLTQAAPHIVRDRSRTHEAWLELARTVREHVDLPELFHQFVGPIQPAGKNGRRGAPEFSASCPACGGNDRLRLWGGPDGRVWCRGCRWSADAIALVQSYVPGCAAFRDAVKFLANIATAEVA